MKVTTTLRRVVEDHDPSAPDGRGDKLTLEYRGSAPAEATGGDVEIVVQIRGPRAVFSNIKIGDSVDYAINLDR